MRNINKNKIFIIFASSLLVIAMIAAGISLAMLSQNTENRANNFTFGNVSIDLSEPEWDELAPEERIVYPGRTISKDPIITNTGENDLYAYIEVSVPKKTVRTVKEENGREVIVEAELLELFSFNANDGWTLITRDDSSEDYTTYLYAYTAEVLSPNKSTNALFDEVTYVNMLEGEIPMGTVLEMPINAYAIQSEYLNEQGDSIEDKMTDAFNKYKDEEK